jgi:putative toxin-antitoxin system antitoxin component (TIGR02293 family)
MPISYVQLATEGSMSDVFRTARMVGGKAVVGRSIRDGIDLAQAVRRGLPVSAVEHMLETGRLTMAEMEKVVLPRKTLANRRKVGTLTAEQSDRLVRVARVLAMAEETFGNQEKAAIWLRRPTTALAGERPLALLDTDEGARAVESLLGRIGHGIAA